jgi:hypothetical protein
MLGQQKKFVQELPFEVQGDRATQVMNVPRMSRVAKGDGSESLFHGIKFFLLKPMSESCDDLLALLTAGGAQILTKKPAALKQTPDAFIEPKKPVVVFDPEHVDAVDLAYLSKVQSVTPPIIYTMISSRSLNVPRGE